MKLSNKIKIIIILFSLTFLTLLNPFISVKGSNEVILGGESIGMELNGAGLIVSNTTTIHYNDDISYNPSKDSDIQKGDLIYQIENKKINNIKDLEDIIEEFEDEIILVNIKIKRKNKDINKKLTIYKIDNTYKTGLFVKEKILGIGTLTFIDPISKKYAALGHEVRDSDYQNIYPISGGTIYESKVTGIKKSVDGNPGEKIAKISKKSEIGTINKNTVYGIYGKYEGDISNNLIETSDKVKKGIAYIRTVLKDDVIKEYEIEITNVREQNEKATKGFSFKVIDKELLNETNGIVQGMSGSPIIQENKLIGAVTHVVVDECNSGHGIYIRWMIDELNS